MVSKEVHMQNIAVKGDHLPSRLVQLACRYDSSIKINIENRQFNAKSLMGILSFPFEEGLALTVTATGADENDAIQAIADYLQ